MRPTFFSPERYVQPWPPLLVARCAGSPRPLHSHHAIQCVLAVDGQLRFRTSRRGRWRSAAGVLIAPDCPHATDSEGVELLVFFFDPESDAGVSLQAATLGGFRLISSSERNELTRGINDDPSPLLTRRAAEWFETVFTTLGVRPPNAQRVIHPAVRRLLRHLRSPQALQDSSLKALAEAVSLSSGRLMHVFTESIGIPLRPYLSWLRIQCAASAICSGATLTEAAHAAGFADASHLSRSFKRRTGMNPAAVRFVTVVRPS